MADYLSCANIREAKVSAAAAINSIDLSEPDIHQSVALVKRACMDCGFFYLINHGISQEFMDEVFAQSKKFFYLPKNEKMKLGGRKNFRGYKPPLEIDFGEAYTFDIEAIENVGVDAWPPADLLPGFKETMQRYQRETLGVGRAVARIIALALDLNADFFDQSAMLGEDTASLCSYVHYGDQHTDASKEKLGTCHHCDTGLITLLATDEKSGLQICRDKDAKPQLWENVSPLKGAFIVNIGDILERMSNFVFRSTLHRVLYREERYSIGVFLVPSLDFVIECLPSCQSEENPAKYPPIKCAEFMMSSAAEVVAASTIESNTKA